MKYTITLLIALVSLLSHAQNVGIGTRDPKNKLHIAGGLRIDSLASMKAKGIVLNTEFGDVYSVRLTGRKSDVLRGDGTFSSATLATDAWLLLGNAGTDSNTNFIGTTDNRPVRFRVNNQWFGNLGPNVSLGRNSYGSNPVEGHPFAGDNVAIGNWALSRNTSGNFNVAVGTHALRDLFGNRNTAIGYNAIRGTIDPSINEVGSDNTAVGADALRQGTLCFDNTVVGSNAMRENRLSSRNVAIGQGALQHVGNTGSQDGQNVAAGTLAMFSATDAFFNTAIGHEALYSAGEPTFTTAVGYKALYADHGSGNTANGALALTTNTTGTSNTAAGNSALTKNTTGSANAAFGHFAGAGNTTGSHNTAVGSSALRKSTGQLNSALGSSALLNNSTGTSNTGLGYQALTNNQTGHSNTSAGTRSLANNISGQNNTAIGYGSLLTNTMGSQNTAVGMFADVTAAGLFNATAIGYGAKVNASNKVRIGNAAVTKIEGAVPFTTPSDARFKFNVKEDVSGLDFIMKLRPVTYQFDVRRFDNTTNVSLASYQEATMIRRTGFIAQEVEKAARETDYDFSGVIRPTSDKEHYSLSYESFVVPLVKAVQEQQQVIDSQNKKINELMKRIEQLEKR